MGVAALGQKRCVPPLCCAGSPKEHCGVKPERRRVGACHGALRRHDSTAVEAPADDWQPSRVEAVQCFREVVSYGKVRGPEWDAVLTAQQLLVVAEAMRFPDLALPECERVLAGMPKNGDDEVSFEEFVQATRTGPEKELLRSFVHYWKVAHSQGHTAPQGYDYTRPTCEAYGVQDTSRDSFFGKFAAIRATLDYKYHSNYTRERQDWQDKAIEAVVCREAPLEKPWLVYTCGPMGVGKGYALSWMSQNGYFPLERVAHVDPDQFKSMMPEWAGYVQQSQETAGSQCHKESCLMMEIAQEAAMSRSQNVWVDGSLRDGDWYEGVFRGLRQRFPNYSIAIFYVTAPEQVIRDRVAQRAKKTGRDVPEDLLRKSLSAMDHSLNRLTPLCNFVVRIDNSGQQPSLSAYEKVDLSGQWSVVQDEFA